MRSQLSLINDHSVLRTVLHRDVPLDLYISSLYLQIDMNYMDFVFDSWRLFPHHLVGFAIRVRHNPQA